MVQRIIRRIGQLLFPAKKAKSSPSPAAKPLAQPARPPGRAPAPTVRSPAPAPAARSSAAHRPAPTRPAETPHRSVPARSAPARSTESAPHPAQAAKKPAVKWTPEQYPIEPVEGKRCFAEFNLQTELLHALADLNFKYCTPIQAQSLEPALAGRDVTGQAQTGTGKTAVFLITIIERCLKNPRLNPVPGTPRSLILAPTRELAIQIGRDADALTYHTGLSSLVVFGGLDYARQRIQLEKHPVDILIATPGRLLDFMGQGKIHLGQAEILILDEADRMLDMGFIPDVRRIIRALPPREKRQSFLFSATLTPEVHRLAQNWLKDPVKIEIEPEKMTVDTIEQKVFLVSSRQKGLLLRNLLKTLKPTRALIFANRRDTCRHVSEGLSRNGMPCAMLSGEVSQGDRLRILESFRKGDTPILVATDVAGRGLHVEGVTHVFNYDIPYEPEDYVHRIGRTGRAGAVGLAITLACENESFTLPEIEKKLGHSLPCEVPSEELMAQR